MNVIIEPEAEQDLREVKPGHRSYIKHSLQELKSEPTGHAESKVIQVKGRQVFRYTMKQGKKGGKDYRAIYDIREGEVRVAAIFHRDYGYNKEEISNRL